jgi:hypothetical protein
MVTEFLEQIIVERNKYVDGIFIGEIQKIATENGICTSIILNEKAIVEALEKHLPRKPFDNYGKGHFCCCLHKVSTSQKYCDQCGQALDWSDHPTEKGR